MLKRIVCLLGALFLISLSVGGVLAESPERTVIHDYAETRLAFTEPTLESGLSSEPDWWYGAIWLPFEHHFEGFDWERADAYCQRTYSVPVTSTKIYFCVREGNELKWIGVYDISCNRICSACPDYWNEAGCSGGACSQGQWGNIFPCLEAEISTNSGRPKLIKPPVKR